MRIAVVGSRRFKPELAVREYVRALPSSTVVISGGAPGVDTWAVEEARKRGLKVEVYKADWQRDGKAAGFKRNAVLVAKSDAVVAFWDRRSRGTANTIKLAEREKMPLAIIQPDPDGEGLMLITSEEPENLYLARREGH